MPSDPFVELGKFLSTSEAEQLAVQLQAGQLTKQALGGVGQSRRDKARSLLAAAGISHADPDRAVMILRAIQGAKSIHRDLTPVWTMPGNEAQIGHLTSEFPRYVREARQSVTCATYNFEQSSGMWRLLKETSEQPDVVVTLYIDGKVADGVAVKAQLPKATVYRSRSVDGPPTGRQHVKSHAKFVIVDHEVLLLTSANFSFTAENKNVEFGLLIRDSALAQSVEKTMSSKHGSLYELV